MKMQACEVCSQSVSKYKCPQCRIRYCSLDCFKNHKNSSCNPTSAAVARVSNQISPISVQGPAIVNRPSGLTPAISASEEHVESLLKTIPDDNKLRINDLERLGKSDAIKGLWKDSPVKELTAEILNSKSRSEAHSKITSLMNSDPKFADLARTCLDIVKSDKN